MLETQHIPLEQLKAQRDKTHEELCRLDWLICKEQNRQADEMRLHRDAAMKQFQGGTGQPPAWQFQPVNDGRLPANNCTGGGGGCGHGRDGVMLFTVGGLPKTYIG